MRLGNVTDLVSGREGRGATLMKVTQRVPALRGELADHLGARTDSCDRIELQRASIRRNIMLKGSENYHLRILHQRPLSNLKGP